MSQRLYGGGPSQHVPEKPTEPTKPKKKRKRRTNSECDPPPSPKPLCQGIWIQHQEYHGWDIVHGNAVTGKLKHRWKNRKTGQITWKKPDSWNSEANTYFYPTSDDDHEDTSEKKLSFPRMLHQNLVLNVNLPQPSHTTGTASAPTSTRMTHQMSIRIFILMCPLCSTLARPRPPSQPYCPLSRRG